MRILNVALKIAVALFIISLLSCIASFAVFDFSTTAMVALILVIVIPWLALIAFVYITDKKQQDHLSYFVKQTTSEQGIDFTFRFDENDSQVA